MGPEEIFKICRNLWCKTPWEIKAEIFSRLTYLSAENLKEENLMRFEIEPVGNSLVVKLYGEIDQHCVGEIRNDIDRLISLRNPAVLIMDLGGVELMDSSGLGLIMGRYKIMAARGGQVRLIRPKPHVDKVLELAGIKKILEKNCG